MAELCYNYGYNMATACYNPAIPMQISTSSQTKLALG